MLSIRLRRTGKKHQPSFRLIVVDKRKDPWGDYVEALGTYNPRTNPKQIQFNAERIQHWLKQGAQASPTVWNLLIDQKIAQGDKVQASKGGKKKAAEATAAAS
jgi:small subunit ribosomal protein S16